jgi:tRNA(fMet)-specific endonuclease VapC
VRQQQNFLTNVAVEEVLRFDRAVAELAGRIAGELERTGQPIGLADPMIAAIALSGTILLRSDSRLAL